MNKKLPNLPMEIINKILIMRPPHPVANLLKLYINHYEDGDWYYNKYMIPDFHEWFFWEKQRNSFKKFKNYKGQIYLFLDHIFIYESSDNVYRWSLTEHEDYIHNRIYTGCCFGEATERILGYIDKIHKKNLNLYNTDGTKRISK
jgi:hypothetical protein